MRLFYILLLLGLFIQTSTGQFLTQPRASKKATVYEQIGITDVTIEYSRPAVNGREGQIWGNLIPYGDGNPIPWRAGANENTVVSFSTDVAINDNPLSAGKYGVHIIPSESYWIIIFSTNHTSWGSFSYNPEEDALRIIIEPEQVPFVERLQYDFINQTDNSADVRLQWENLGGQFTISVDVHNLVLDNMDKELRSNLGFNWQAWQEAANYCMQNDIYLERGLAYAERSISGGFGAQPTFTNLNTKSQILKKLGKEEESIAALAQALPLASMTELHFYGRSLIQSGDPEGATEIFEMNREKNPNDDFTTLVGLARGNMALGNMNQAAKYFRQAAPNAPAGQQPFYEQLAEQAEAQE